MWSSISAGRITCHSHPNARHSQSDGQTARTDSEQTLQQLDVTALLAARFVAGFNRIFPTTAPNAAELCSAIKALSWRLLLAAKVLRQQAGCDIGQSQMLLICLLHFSYANARQNAVLQNPTLERGSFVCCGLRSICMVVDELAVGLDGPTGGEPHRVAFYRGVAVFHSRVWCPLVRELHTTSAIMLRRDTLLGAFWDEDSAGKPTYLVEVNIDKTDLYLNYHRDCGHLDERSPHLLLPDRATLIAAEEFARTDAEAKFALTATTGAGPVAFQRAWDQAWGQDAGTQGSIDVVGKVQAALKLRIAAISKRVDHDLSTVRVLESDAAALRSDIVEEGLLHRLFWALLSAVAAPTVAAETQAASTSTIVVLCKPLLACCVEVVSANSLSYACVAFHERDVSGYAYSHCTYCFFAPRRGCFFCVGVIFARVALLRVPVVPICTTRMPCGISKGRPAFTATASPIIYQYAPSPRSVRTRSAAHACVAARIHSVRPASSRCGCRIADFDRVVARLSRLHILHCESGGISGECNSRRLHDR
jgi:hypothetical protein